MAQRMFDLRLLARVACFAIVLLFAAEAQSQEPSPGVPQTQIPSVAESQTGDISKPITNTRETNSTDWWMFWATVGIGFIGFLQLVAFVTQAVYLRSAAQEMHATTEAARKVAEDQIAHSHQVERAYISCGGWGKPVRVQQPDGTISNVMTGQFEVQINNHGKTPGQIRRIAIEFCKAGAAPSVPVYELPEYNQFIAHDNWIGPGTQSRDLFPRKPSPDLPDQMIVYGRVYYRDIFSDDEHSSGFFQDFDRQTGDSESIVPPSDVYLKWT
jgi:hypothetical protein